VKAVNDKGQKYFRRHLEFFRNLSLQTECQSGNNKNVSHYSFRKTVGESVSAIGIHNEATMRLQRTRLRWVL
jgi:hypothetical protein